MRSRTLRIPSLYGLLIVILGSFFLLVYVVFFGTVPRISIRSNVHKQKIKGVMGEAGKVFSLLERTSFEAVSQIRGTENLHQKIESSIQKQHDNLIGSGVIKKVEISFSRSRTWEDTLKKNEYGFSYLEDKLILKLPVVGIQKGSFQVSVLYDYRNVIQNILRRSLSEKHRVIFTRNGSMLVSLQKENIGENLIQDIGKSIETPCYGGGTYFFRGQNINGLCEVLMYMDRSVIFLYRGGAPVPIMSQILFGILFSSTLGLFFLCYRDVNSRGEKMFFRQETLPEVPMYLYEKKGIPVNSELHMLIESVLETTATQKEEISEKEKKKREISKEAIIAVGRNILHQLFRIDIEKEVLDQIRSQMRQNQELHYMVLRNQNDEYVVTENEGFSEETKEKFRFSSRAKIVSLLENGKKLVEIDNQKQNSQFLQEKFCEEDVVSHPTLLCIPFTIDKILQAIVCIG